MTRLSSHSRTAAEIGVAMRELAGRYSHRDAALCPHCGNPGTHTWGLHRSFLSTTRDLATILERYDEFELPQQALPTRNALLAYLWHLAALGAVHDVIAPTEPSVSQPVDDSALLIATLSHRSTDPRSTAGATRDMVRTEATPGFITTVEHIDHSLAASHARDTLTRETGARLAPASDHMNDEPEHIDDTEPIDYTETAGKPLGDAEVRLGPNTAGAGESAQGDAVIYAEEQKTPTAAGDLTVTTCTIGRNPTQRLSEELSPPSVRPTYEHPTLTANYDGESLEGGSVDPLTQDYAQGGLHERPGGAPHYPSRSPAETLTEPDDQSEDADDIIAGTDEPTDDDNEARRQGHGYEASRREDTAAASLPCAGPPSTDYASGSPAGDAAGTQNDAGGAAAESTPPDVASTHSAADTHSRNEPAPTLADTAGETIEATVEATDEAAGETAVEANSGLQMPTPIPACRCLQVVKSFTPEYFTSNTPLNETVLLVYARVARALSVVCEVRAGLRKKPAVPGAPPKFGPAPTAPSRRR